MARDTRQRDGRRRRANPLPEDGVAGGRAPARRLRPAAGGAGRRPRACRPMPTDRRHGAGGADHGFARQCEVATPAQAGAGDIPDRWPAAGWRSLAVRLEVYARTVGGGAMRRPIDPAWGPQAVERARGRRRPAAGLGHPGDRGRQEARPAARTLLAAHGSGGRRRGTGAGLEQAVAERCCGRGKRAGTAHGDSATRHAATAEILADRERCENSRRKHASLGDIRPHDSAQCSWVAELRVLFSLTRTPDVRTWQVIWENDSCSRLS
jgi:hypothetical protein